MSSRILSADEAASVRPLRWAPAGSPPGSALAPSAHGDGSGSADPEEVAQLRSTISRLEAEAAMRESQARQTGRQEGEATARQQLEGPLGQAAARLAERVEELAVMRKRLRREAEEDLVRLAVAISRRVLHRELTADPEAILGIVKAALDRIDARELTRVRVNPDDIDRIRAAVSARNVPAQVEVVADPGLERGGLMVETTRGSLDASVESQLLEIERGFTDLVRRKSG